MKKKTKKKVLKQKKPNTRKVKKRKITTKKKLEVLKQINRGGNFDGTGTKVFFASKHKKRRIKDGWMLV